MERDTTSARATSGSERPCATSSATRCSLAVRLSRPVSSARRGRAPQPRAPYAPRSQAARPRSGGEVERAPQGSRASARRFARRRAAPRRAALARTRASTASRPAQSPRARAAPRHQPPTELQLGDRERTRCPPARARSSSSSRAARALVCPARVRHRRLAERRARTTTLEPVEQLVRVGARSAWRRRALCSAIRPRRAWSHAHTGQRPASS